MSSAPLAEVRYAFAYHVYATVTDEGAMLLDTRGRGRWSMVNPAGALLMRGLLDGMFLPHAADAVAVHYRADRDRVHADMGAMVGDLTRRGLLRPLAAEEGSQW